MWDNELMLQRDLTKLPVDQLRTMLNAEVQKDAPDDDLVLAILHILEDRDPVVMEQESEKEKTAGNLFRKRIRARRKRKPLFSSKLLRAASVVVVVWLLFALVPQQTEADNWWQRLTKWSDEFFGFFREEEDVFHLADYEFRTDNPGLQQVYEAVTKIGITIPAVPMWLPEGYGLSECTVEETPVKQYVHARFLNGEKECVLQINVLNAEDAKVYYKNEMPVEQYEEGGMIHSVVRNMDRWVASWTKDNIECSIFIDCQEDVLHEIIQSVYKGRINK